MRSGEEEVEKGEEFSKRGRGERQAGGARGVDGRAQRAWVSEAEGGLVRAIVVVDGMGGKAWREERNVGCAFRAWVQPQAVGGLQVGESGREQEC